jgi:TRAP-type C4-dicarboxylate transport system permease small subunit
MKLSSERFFYRIFLPVAVAVNLALGIIVLSDLNPQDWRKVLVIGTGAFCCFVAGSLASAAWTKSYWGNTMARQIATWRRIADTIFAWLEDAPLPAEALNRLKRSLDEVVPEADQA